MKLSSLLIPAFLLVLLYSIFSCSKSNGGKPSISIESITRTVDQNTGNMVATLKFKSPGGKLSGGSFYSLRLRLNQDPPPPTSGYADTNTLQNLIPSFPNQTSGEMIYTLPYNGYLSSGGSENDTLLFKLWVIDAANNVSDTITSPQVVIINQ
ncbi:MAG: hypothetical protein P4L51_28080 [Puia sp.]|nr:hypothetical protein [Puia sp.]